MLCLSEACDVFETVVTVNAISKHKIEISLIRDGE